VDVRSSVIGLDALHHRTWGDRGVTVAVLDGPVDVSHPCFAGADLRTVETLVREPPAGDSPMAVHGTHVASLLFGQPGSEVEGIAPGCRGVIAPVFTDDRVLSQVDLARAIERAVSEGAHVISISGGQESGSGQPDGILANALQLCEASNVLVVAAVGNDGTDRVQVPAAAPDVLAVGAADERGNPLSSNNVGAEYEGHTVLAPGHRIRGAAPGGGTVELTGSSIATPVVAGVAALLLSLERAAGADVDPQEVGREIVATARLPDEDVDVRLRAGQLDVLATLQSTRGARMAESSAPAVEAGHPQAATPAAGAEPAPPPAAPPAAATTVAAAGTDAAQGTSCGCGCDHAGTGSSAGSPIFVIGSIGHDFRTEANRDGFITQMPNPPGDHILPANPYDPAQLHDFLAMSPWYSDKLTWICKHEGMPIYALEAEVPYGMDWGSTPTVGAKGVVNLSFTYPPVSVVHKTFRDALRGQALDPASADYVSRVSIPGRLTNRTVRLFSGQVLPVVTVQAGGLYTWNETALIDTLVEEINVQRQATVGDPVEVETVRLILRAFLDKVYYQFRNLGQSGADRAVNYAATNAFSLVSELANGFLSGRLTPRPAGDVPPLYALDDISVQPSQYTRIDSECYDVIITFFDPTNDRQSRVAYLYVIDVSEVLPVPLAPTRQFLIGR
jgi:hypothetical protein